MNFFNHLANTQFIKTNLCICSVFCQSSDVTVTKRNISTHTNYWMVNPKREIYQNDHFKGNLEVKNYLRQYMSCKESRSSTIGIAPTSAAKQMHHRSITLGREAKIQVKEIWSTYGEEDNPDKLRHFVRFIHEIQSPEYDWVTGSGSKPNTNYSGTQ